MRSKVLILLLPIFLLTCSTRQELSTQQKLYLTAKVWGFLKYYHPTVNQGTLNWDQELIRILKELPSADTKEALSTLFLNWIESLGEIPARNSSYDSSSSFDKNFNLSWFENEFFTNELTNRLRFIEQNRAATLHYVKSGYVGQIELINEPAYTAAHWSDQDIRFVTLFRYWNVIEYFYPYKFKLDKHWDDLLLYFIPAFMEVTSEQDYHLRIRELTVSLCDSHAFFSTDLVRTYAGANYIPAKFVILDSNAVVNDFYDDSLARVDDLRWGDVITAVNDVPVFEIYRNHAKYINGSNEAVKKLSYSFRWIFNGATDSVKITFKRDGKVSTKTIRRYPYAAFKSEEAIIKWKRINPAVGYVNMGEVLEEDLPTLMQELNHSEAIIFDFRNYPEFIIDELLGYLNPEPKEFAMFIQPDLSYPGRFVWTKPVVCGRDNPNPYQGRVLILVNEETQSRSEYFVMAMQTVAGSITIGRQTSGADGDVVDYTFFDDKTSWITGRGVFYPDGRETQRIGIALDVEVPITVDDIAAGRDAILEKAIEIAAKGN